MTNNISRRGSYCDAYEVELGIRCFSEAVIYLLGKPTLGLHRRSEHTNESPLRQVDYLPAVSDYSANRANDDPKRYCSS